MQQLTLAEVVRACRTARENNQLGYQTGKTLCLYLYDDGCRCAVGHALSPETIEEIKRRDLMAKGVARLVDAGVLRIGDLELYQVAMLQEAHDSICISPSSKREERIENFNRTLDRFISQIEENDRIALTAEAFRS